MLLLRPRSQQAATGEPDAPVPGAAHQERIGCCRPPPPAGSDGHLQRGQSPIAAVLVSRGQHCILLFLPFAPLLADDCSCVRALQGLGAAERLRAGFRTFKRTIYEWVWSWRNSVSRLSLFLIEFVLLIWWWLLAVRTPCCSGGSSQHSPQRYAPSDCCMKKPTFGR
jgi:hypothetical protein